MQTDLKKKVLIAGSKGAIGRALSLKYEEMGWQVLRLSRSENSDLTVNLSEDSSVAVVVDFFTGKTCPDLIINCCGLLHDSQNMPEKQLDELNTNWLQKSFQVNLNTHVNLAKAVDKVADSSKSFTWVSLSAMIGSITDNRLGGWYSYRISKASLNMFIKTLSIEWKRKNKQNRAFVIHPGTTKSTMSSPFNVRKDKLYEPGLTAERIISVIESTETEANGQFYNWNGANLLW
ncbi:MAG: SDR family NAD(P)-dependent oxidoreductase [Lentisphaerales bacterium]|nr:SDR family NAD(P)-dependent oxidoreductase [Lentisphaerales bacterium]